MPFASGSWARAVLQVSPTLPNRTVWAQPPQQILKGGCSPPKGSPLTSPLEPSNSDGFAENCSGQFSSSQMRVFLWIRLSPDETKLGDSGGLVNHVQSIGERHGDPPSVPQQKRKKLDSNCPCPLPVTPFLCFLTHGRASQRLPRVKEPYKGTP